MKRRKHPFLAVMCVMAFASSMLASCASVNATLGGNSEQDALAKVVWSYADNAIVLHTVADARLNEHDSQSHTLVLAVVQTADANAFTSLIADPAAVAKLLETGKPAAGLLAVDRFIVKPGVRGTNRMSRAQFAQYFGVIPGYYQLDPKRNARLFPINVQVDSKGWVVKTRTAAPAPLAVRLHLGAYQVAGAQQIGADPSFVPMEATRARATQPGPINVDAGAVLDAARTAQSVRQLTR